jgi:chromosome segregation ATPase
MRLEAMHTTVGMALAVGLTLLAGCASGSGRTEPSETAISSMKETREELGRAQGLVEKTQQALTQLAAAQGDVRPPYQAFTKAVADLQSSADRARKDAEAMQARGREYLASWEKEMAQVSDPQIRSSAAERQAAVRATYREIADTTRDTRASYDAYMKKLQEIQKALANDLTPGGVNTVRPAIQAALADGEALKQQFAVLSGHIDGVYAGMAGGQASGTK